MSAKVFMPGHNQWTVVLRCYDSKHNLEDMARLEEDKTKQLTLLILYGHHQPTQAHSRTETETNTNLDINIDIDIDIHIHIHTCSYIHTYTPGNTPALQCWSDVNQMLTGFSSNSLPNDIISWMLLNGMFNLTQ